MPESKTSTLLHDLVHLGGPTCLLIKAKLQPIGDVDRFQPAGFPEIGHVLYDAPRRGNTIEKVCIVDSPASMANHLETICLAGPNEADLHPDLAGLPYVVCTTDNMTMLGGDTAEKDPQRPHDRRVFTSITEGHRIASDYFLDGLTNPQRVEEQRVSKRRGKPETVPAHWKWQTFRMQLREAFEIVEVKKDKTYFIHPDNWWTIYRTIFQHDPNSLVHGVMFAREQIKLSRILTAHLEAFGASRVGRSGVKFDRLGKTLSGQPIFAVDEETAREIRATFILDLALLRSYGRNGQGLNEAQKQLLLGLALWKIQQLLARPFRFRSQCHLQCAEVVIGMEGTDGNIRDQSDYSPLLDNVDIRQLIAACNFNADPVTRVYYPSNELFKPGKDDEQDTDAGTEENDGEEPMED